MQTVSTKTELGQTPGIMSFDEMKAQFPNEWILIGDPQYDEKHVKLIAGVPLLHDKDKKNLYQHSRERMVGHAIYTVKYTGVFKSTGRTMIGIWRRVG